jgi:hypothetical protein
MDNIEANINAIKLKNAKLSTELAITREQFYQINIDIVVMKKDNIDVMNVTTAEHELKMSTASGKHEEGLYNFVELVGIGTIEEVKHVLRVHREITDKNNFMLEIHNEVRLAQEHL